MIGKVSKKGPLVLKSALEAIECIPNNSRVFLPSVASASATFMNAFKDYSSNLKDIEFVHMHLEKQNPVDGMPQFFTNHIFIGAVSRKLANQGTSSYVPVFLSEAPKLFKSGLLTPDVAILNVSPPDKHGYCSLGVEVAMSYPAAQTARVLIGQINKHQKRTHGYGQIHYSAFDYVVEADEPLAEAAAKTPGEAERQIGKHVASLVPNGATLQMGIGSIPNAVLAELKDHSNLGIHTEMFSDGAIDLIESGVINNLNKQYLPGKVLTSFVVGSKKTYDFVDDNPNVFFVDSSVANDVHIIGSNPRVTAINSAVEVDITGQVCADSIGNTMISGVGGQVDFERGAALSRGGLPMICLPSTTKHGFSRIVSELKGGAGVTTTRPHVHYVITEHGIAQLFGKNLIQRAKALIAIAHPDHRQELERQASERFKIKSW
ncbi:acetyl-CoA hydrolase/transferase [Gorgonomyces haynaldii]|nr:acetyl-CoA hydrolase/transferase [Gorgonomyces haynaldii]